MSNAVFPTLAGLSWNIGRAPKFNTFTHTAVSGRELRGTYQVYPLYNFTLVYEVLRAFTATPDFQTIVGFFLSRQGSFDNFLFTDWTDNSVTDMAFGVGDGSTTGFQLTRAFGAGGSTYAEPVQNINALTNIKIAGSVTGAYTINSTGFVTFSSPPAASAALTWTGTFYYRCRFVHDTADLNNFMNLLWELKTLELIGAPGNRV